MARSAVKKVTPGMEGPRERANLTTSADVPNSRPSSVDLDEITKRLQRLETSGSHGNSDVYKFVSFFIMGVVMTIVLYPHASKAVESFYHKIQTGSEPGFPDTADVEGFVDVDEPVTNINSDIETLINNNNTLLQVNDDIHTDQSLHKEDKGSGKTQTTETNENDSNSVVITSDIEVFEEDPVLGESETEEDIQDSIIQQDNVHTERVKLFNMEGEVGELPIRFVDEEVSEQSKTENIRQSDKKKPNKTIKKSKVSKEAVEGKETSDKSKLPPEIRNFKPTYQTELKPKKIFADGRRIPPMELLAQKPNNSSVKIWMFEEFLSEAECDGLMRVHRQHVESQSKTSPILCFDSINTLKKHLQNVGKHNVKVTPRDFTQGTTCVNASFSGELKTWLKGNWSYSTAFYPGESRFASIFEQRVQEAMGLKPENGGKFQITSYPLGIGYKSHTDCTEGTPDKRDRFATVLVYLDTVTEGGETDFPELGVWVRPRKARALLWNNMNDDGECEPLSIHQAKKVTNGHKVILQRWYYYQSFYSLGKRPPEPPLPRRESGQPRVSCDEFEHGSCRWYDEWNFEHMLEYERQKYNLV